MAQDDKDDDTKPSANLNFKDDEGLEMGPTPENEDGKTSLYQSLVNRILANRQQSSDLNKNATAEAMDKFQMGSNPNLQGPRLGWNEGVNGAEQARQLANQLPMVGSVAKVALPNIAQMVGEATAPVEAQAAQAAVGSAAQKLANAKLLANATADAGADATSVARTQNGLSRATDMDARYAQQLAAAKQAALNKMRGQ